MSTSAVTSAELATPSPAWKQEVNRRLAEHKGRKPAPQPQPQMHAEAHSTASRRALEAAARVAARYANAPSYNEVLANEARAALRAAEAASEAALQARTAAQSVLDGIEAAAAAAAAPAPQLVPGLASARPRTVAANAAPASVECASVETAPAETAQTATASLPPAPSPSQVVMAPMQEIEEPIMTISAESLSIRWAPELPVRQSHPGAQYPHRGDSLFEDEWWKPASAEPLAPGAGEVQVVEPAQPIHGNLIEFPCELVAARKVRPRLAEEPASAQLSIFEVNPLTLSAEPAIETMDAATDAWTASQWSGIELDAQREEFEELVEEPIAPPQADLALEPVAAGRRLMAVMVDGSLIAGAMLGAASLALNNAQSVPGLRTAGMAACAGLLIAAVLYHALFFTLARATPGMKYARIRLSTFDGLTPTRAQRCCRLAATLLSVLPVGLGFAWSLFDEDRLSWHDRLSRTYLRGA